MDIIWATVVALLVIAVAIQTVIILSLRKKMRAAAKKTRILQMIVESSLQENQENEAMTLLYAQLKKRQQSQTSNLLEGREPPKPILWKKG